MPKYTLTNTRKGSWTLLRPKHKDVTLIPGQSIDLDMDEKEAASAAYPGIVIQEAKSEPKADAGKTDATATKSEPKADAGKGTGGGK